MSERKFKVGDRVIGTGFQDGVNLKGLVGTVIDVDSGIYDYSIQFDERNEVFHSCGFLGEDYH